MRVVLICPEENGSVWEAQLRRHDATLDMEVWPDVERPESITYAIVARLPQGVLSPFINLKAILSTWAGVEGLLADTSVPADIPIVRMVEPSLTQGMVEYVCCQVLNAHLRTRLYQDPEWGHPQKLFPRYAPGTRVGVMGLGALGSACAKALTALGFQVLGWSRTEKNIANVESYAGMNALDDFLEQSEIVVGLLPNTPDTFALLNAKRLAVMPKGAAIINAGRGELINDDALVSALESGHIREAILDVFLEEPLPPDHPYRKLPQVTISPHVASVTNPETAAPVLLNTLRRLRQGLPVEHVVDRSHGY